MMTATTQADATATETVMSVGGDTIATRRSDGIGTGITVLEEAIITTAPAVAQAAAADALVTEMAVTVVARHVCTAARKVVAAIAERRPAAARALMPTRTVVRMRYAVAITPIGASATSFSRVCFSSVPTRAVPS